MASGSNQARWSDEEVSVLIPIFLEQKYAGNWAGTGPNSYGLKQISAALETRFSISKTPKQIKNKYESMKSEFSCWTKLKNSETGLGWDHHTGTIQATDEWWIRKIREDPVAKKFKNRSPLLEDLQTELFGNSLATGSNQWTPTSTQFLHDQARDQCPDLNIEHSMEAQYPNWSPGESAMNNAGASDSPPTPGSVTRRGGKSGSRLSGEKRKQMEGSSNAFAEIKEMLNSRTVKVDYNTRVDEDWDMVFEKLNTVFGVEAGNELYMAAVQYLQDDYNRRKVFIRIPQQSIMAWINKYVVI